MGAGLADLLDRAALLRLAGPRSFERGCEYLDWRAVGRVEGSGDGVAAWVQGTERYRVRLFAEDGRLGFDCSCPMGQQLAFCKHCVAVALAVGDAGTVPGPGLDDVMPRLVELGSERLAELLVEHARDDERLARRLQAIALGAGAELDIAAHRALLDDAIVVHGFVPYAEARGYFKGTDEAIDTLDDLLAEGHADAVVELAEHALRCLERAIETVDDSDGGATAAIARLEALHLEACERTDIDRTALAERLLEWQLESDLDLFDDAVVVYAEVLGEAGRDRYRELAQQRWAAVPRLGPGDDRGWDSERFAIGRAMESLASLDGTVEDIVAVRERDLSTGWRFLEIAELLREHDRHDEALAWAERGLAAFPDAPDSRLRAFAVEEYRRRGRSDDALALTARAFDERPGLETWKGLRRDAEAVGEWETRRADALRVLAESVQAAGGEQHWAGRRDRSELVRVHLYEGDVELAWQEACAGGCSPALWIELADLRRESHPDDALAVYKREVAATIERRDKHAYAAAIEAMGSVRELLESTGRGDEFAAYVADVRAEHKRKRNLVKLLDSMPA